MDFLPAFSYPYLRPSFRLKSHSLSLQSEFIRPTQNNTCFLVLFHSGVLFSRKLGDGSDLPESSRFGRSFPHT